MFFFIYIVNSIYVNNLILITLRRSDLDPGFLDSRIQVFLLKGWIRIPKQIHPDPLPCFKIPRYDQNITDPSWN